MIRMKVIKEGASHLTDIICEQCKSELQYGPQDVSHTRDIFYNRVEFTDSIKCPVCGNVIVVNRDVIIREFEQKKKINWFWWCK